VKVGNIMLQALVKTSSEDAYCTVHVYCVSKNCGGSATRF